MFCRNQVIGIALLFLGVGLLAGCLLPSCLLVWLLALLLVAGGIFLLQC